MWLDAVEHRWVDELSGMNVFVVRDGALVTPPIGDTILDGITRDSIIRVASSMGIDVHETPIDVEKWIVDARNGVVTEAFACGTAAVFAPIGTITSAAQAQAPRTGRAARSGRMNQTIQSATSTDTWNIA